MISVFILPLNHFRNWDAQREELTNAQREKEREKERLTYAQREKDRAVDRDLAFTPIAILRSTAPIAIWRSTAPIAISQSTAPIAISPSCRSQPLVEPSRLSLFLLLSIWSDLMIFFWVLFVFLYWGMNDIIYLFGNRENVTGFDDFFFWVLFVFLYWGMNDIIYSFGSRENVRKCEQQVENVFSMVFSRTQPNTRKYFSKHFLKCN